MCFLRNGTLERAVSATGRLRFIPKLQIDVWRWPPNHTRSYHQASRHAHTHLQVMLYHADLLKVNLITLVIPDQRVFLPVKNPSRGKKERIVCVWDDNKSKSDFMKVASETGQSIRRVADCGRVATRGARRGARRSISLCQSPEAVCPCHKDIEVIRTNCTKSHTSSPPTALADKAGWCRNTGGCTATTGGIHWFVTSNTHPLIPIDAMMYDVVMTLLLLLKAPRCQQGFTQSDWFLLNAF